MSHNIIFVFDFPTASPPYITLPLPLSRAMQVGSGAEIGAVTFTDFDLNRLNFHCCFLKCVILDSVLVGTKSTALV